MRSLLILLLLIISFSVHAQYFETEKRLIAKVESAKTDAEKVAALEPLAEFYYIYRADKKADSVMQKQLLIAEESNNKQLLLSALFSRALGSMNIWSTKETYEKAQAFLDKGLKYARETGNRDYEALAHIRKAEIFRKRNDYDAALEQAALALASAERTEKDSLRVVIYIETGDILARKRQSVDAYKNYNNAFDLAYEIGDTELQSEVYYRFASLYQALGSKDLPKMHLLKSLELNQAADNQRGLLRDYIELARFTEEKDYIDRSLALAAKSTDERQKYFAIRVAFSYYVVKEKNIETSLKFLETNEGLKQSFINAGIAHYYYNLGHIYYYANQADSALRYYLLAEPALTLVSDDFIKYSVYKQIAESYEKSKSDDKALPYYQKALEVAKGLNEITYLSAVNKKISDLYARQGDYQAAYTFNSDHSRFKFKLDSLSEDRNLVLLEVQRENRKHEKDLADKKAQDLRSRNLGYLAISLATAAFFIVLVFFGMFPTNRFAIKMLSFFAFICLFEFIILLIDNWLHHLTHGDPLQIWLAKVGIIAVLLPLHHYLDHLSYQFLSSHKLEKLRQQFSVKKMISKIRVAGPEHVAAPKEETNA